MLFANQNSPKGELVISNVKMTNWSPIGSEEFNYLEIKDTKRE